MKVKTSQRSNVKRAIGVVCLFASLGIVTASAATVNMLSCCPGENTAREARFVWHSSADNCLLFIAKAADPADDIHTVLPRSKTKKPMTFRSSDVTYYKYEAEIADLEPGTEYIYWVEIGDEKFPVQRFKTAGTGGSYNFLWMSDVHAHPDNPGKIANVNKLYADAVSKTASSGGIDFIFFTGDYAKYGSCYDNWQQWNGSPAMTENMFALLVGNHEYYYTNGKTNVPGRSVTKMWHNKWALACRNDPKNGAMGASERLETSYWFLRDGVLFICIDSLVDYTAFMSDDLYNNAVSYQKTWFRNVVESQAGKYRWLIVAQHDPWMKKESTSAMSSTSDYREWYSLFDEFKVDLALSSDDHVYHRSNPLRGDAKQSSTADGTVYMVSPCIDEKNSSTSLLPYGSFSGDAAKYLYTASESGAFGACCVEVRPEGLKVTYFWDDVNGSYSKKDEFTVLPKDRGWVYESFGKRAHTRYRFAVDAPRSDSGKMQLSEIQLLDANGNVIQPSEFTLAWDSTTTNSAGQKYPSGENPGLAADGKLNTKWLDYRAGLDNPAEVRAAVWLDFCFSTAVKISGYRWYTANDDVTYPSRTPVAWTLTAFDDGDDTCYILDRVVGYDPPKENKVLAYPLPDSPDEPEEPVEPESPVVTTAGGTYYALSVGVNNYKNNRQQKLGGCVADAEDVLSACTNSTKGLWSPANSQCLCDAGAAKSDVRAQFNAIAAQAQSGDTVLYYQSSHGGDDCICLYDYEYYADELASDLMEFRSGVRVVVVLDTCHSGSMFKDGSGILPESGPWAFAASVEAYMDEMRASVQTKGLKAAASGPSVGWVTACDDDQLSVESNGRGWFTRPFVTAWKADTTDANGDGWNDFKEAFNIAAPQAINAERAPQTMNESLLRSVAAYEVYPHLPDSVWTGAGGDGDFSNPANWEGGEVPVAGCALNFAGLSTNATINVDVQDAVFTTIIMGAKVVTFTGDITASAITDTSKVAVGENATVTLDGDLTYSETTGGGWMLDHLDGTFVVNGDIVVSSSADMKLAQSIGANGVAVARGLVSNGNKPWTFRLNRSDSGDTARWVIGENGLSGNSGFWVLANGENPSSSAIIQPNASDFVIADWIGARIGPTLTIDTTGWVDDAPHVITATAGFLREGVVSVVGEGTLVCDYDSTGGAYDQNINSVAFDVGESATLALAAGSNIGDGEVTVNGGAALELSGAGTATIGGALKLKGGSRLVVGTSGAAANVGSLALPESGTVDVSFSAELGVNVATTILSFSGNQTLTAEDLAKFSLPDGYILSLGSGGKSVVATRYSGTWTGGMALSVPVGGVSIGSATFDVSDASRANPITVTVGDGGTLSADSDNLVLSAATLPDASPAEYMSLVNDVPPGYAAIFHANGTAIYVTVVPVTWIAESAARQQVTGTWSETVVYGEDGRAYLDSNGGEIAFVPYSASTGNVVTVETKAQFFEYSKDDLPGETAQAAVRLSTNGCFQVWAQDEWLDVAAADFTPESGEEYTLRFTFDYAANTYSVEVETGSTGFTRLVERGNPVNPVNPVKTTFPIAFQTNCVTSVAFRGDTYFTSLGGDCRMVVVGFAKDESLVLKDNAEVILDAAKAAWLNKCGDGDKAAIQLAAAGLSEKELNDAYLLNLDITDGDRTYTFAVTDVDVGDTSVTVTVMLTRSGEIEQAINGTLKFYGAATLADFKTAAAPLGSATLSNDNFSKGDTATATIPLDGETPPAFFKANIEAE